jgi:hypothetical protein
VQAVSVPYLWALLLGFITHPVSRLERIHFLYIVAMGTHWH